MRAKDARQSQDERAKEREGAQDAREEYTTYREVEPDRASPEEADARREADLQPAPPGEGDQEGGTTEEGQAE